MKRKLSKNALSIIKLILALLFLAMIFLSITILKKKAIQEIEDAVELCISLAKYAEHSQRQSFVAQCKIYLGTPCSQNSQCGPFPCINNQCYIKPCSNDDDCQQSLCSQYLTPIKNFCTITDVK